MTTYPPVRRLGTGGDLRTDAREWLGSAPLRDLVAAFGGDASIYAGDDPADWAARLDTFSARWDARRGAERNMVTPLDLTPPQEAATAAAVEAFELDRATSPRDDRYDHVLMLGGLVRACVARPAYAASLVASGRIRARAVTALAGHRPFRGDEFELARVAELADVSDEFAALDAGTRRAFALGDPDRAESTGAGNADWTIRHYTAPDGTPVRVAAAPSTDPARRANTADTYEWFARSVATLREGETVLVVTSAIYVHAQHADALRMLALPYGARVETVGIRPGDVVPALAQTFTPTHYLLEIRSAIRAMHSLLGALDGGSG